MLLNVFPVCSIALLDLYRYHQQPDGRWILAFVNEDPRPVAAVALEEVKREQVFPAMGSTLFLSLDERRGTLCRDFEVFAIRSYLLARIIYATVRVIARPALAPFYFNTAKERGDSTRGDASDVENSEVMCNI
mgnify:CR=1 FL=1